GATGWTLYGPDGQSLGSVAMDLQEQTPGDLDLLLPVSGSYTLALWQQDAAQPLNYQLRAIDLSSGAAALTIGTSYTGLTVAARSATVYTFAAVAGQQIRYAALGIGGGLVDVS